MGVELIAASAKYLAAVQSGVAAAKREGKSSKTYQELPS